MLGEFVLITGKRVGGLQKFEESVLKFRNFALTATKTFINTTNSESPFRVWQCIRLVEVRRVHFDRSKACVEVRIVYSEFHKACRKLVDVPRVLFDRHKACSKLIKTRRVCVHHRKSCRSLVIV